MTESAKSVGDLDDLARDLRQGAGREVRAEAAVDEELTELQRLRRMGLGEAARSAMHRGDRVTVTGGGLTLSHPVLTVGDDYLTLEESSDRFVDVRLEAVVMDVSPRTSGGRTGRPAAATLQARLAELEQEAVTLELVTTSGDRRDGRIRVVGRDHVLVAGDGRQSYVPFGSVAVVFSPFPPRRN